MANNILEKVSNKLNTIKSISYDYYRSINYFSENYHNETSGNTYLEFLNNANVIGFKYQLEADEYKMIYNGAEIFFLNKKDKTIKINYKPKLNDFTQLSFLVNSIITLKQALPSIIVDKQISKNLVDT